MKMKDVFNLPIKSVDYQNQIRDSKDVQLLFADFHEYEKDAICEAINNHDRLTEENEKLKAAIKSFYEACETENEIEVQASMETMMDLVDCLELTKKGE